MGSPTELVNREDKLVEDSIVNPVKSYRGQEEYTGTTQSAFSLW